MSNVIQVFGKTFKKNEEYEMSEEVKTYFDQIMKKNKKLQQIAKKRRAADNAKALSKMKIKKKNHKK